MTKLKKRIKEEFSVMGLESTSVMLDILRSTNLDEYTPGRLAVLGRAMLSGIRRSRLVVSSPESSNASVVTCKELIEESFSVLEDIIFYIKQAQDNDEISNSDRNSIIAFIAEHIKCCSEEELFRAKLEEQLTADELELAENIKQKHGIMYPEKKADELVLDGISVKDIMNDVI